MPHVIVDLFLSKDSLLQYYSGQAQTIEAIAHNGQKVRFRAQHVRPFVTNSGLHGTFKIEFTTEGRFENIEQIK